MLKKSMLILCKILNERSKLQIKTIQAFEARDKSGSKQGLPKFAKSKT